MSIEDPLRLKVRDRLIRILEGIQEGGDYHFRPAKVFKVDVLEVECPGYPCYSVHPGQGSRAEELTDHHYDMTCQYVVKGIVKDMEDPGAAVIKASRDAARAIDQDWRSGESGSLGELAAAVSFPEPATMDSGFFSGMGLGYFEQPVEFLLTGNIDDF